MWQRGIEGGKRNADSRVAVLREQSNDVPIDVGAMPSPGRRTYVGLDIYNFAMASLGTVVIVMRNERG